MADFLQESDRFSSYDEYMIKLKAFLERACSQFTTVATERLSKEDDLHQRMRYRVIRYQCKQGQRLKGPESKQARPVHRSFKVGCPVQLNVRLNRPKNKDPFLKVTKLVTEHEGHEVLKEVYQLYPEQRRICVDETDRVVLSALSMRTSEQRHILEQRHGSAVMTQNVCNMQWQMGIGKGAGWRDDVKCEAILNDIISKGGHGEVGRDENGIFQFATFQSKSMKALLCKFPETLIMDCTYKVNHYLYLLMTIMVIDDEGHGMPVFHAFLAKEDRHIMEGCLRIFARQFSPDHVHCFIVDKDMAEIAAMGTVFPGVPVNLCQFHISQAVERRLKKELGRGGAIWLKLCLTLS